MDKRFGLFALAGMMMAAASKDRKPALAPEQRHYCAECENFPKGSYCKPARHHVGRTTSVHNCEHFNPKKG
jgi:hypothetical protein